MQPPGSTDARYDDLAGALGRSAEDQEDLWLYVLERWGLTIDAWEALPGWQQRAYLTAQNRQAQRTQEQARAQGDEAKRAGKVAGRKGRRPPPAGRGGDEQRRAPSGGRTKLRNSHLWEGRRTAPPVLPRMTGQRPTPRPTPS